MAAWLRLCSRGGPAHGLGQGNALVGPQAEVSRELAAVDQASHHGGQSNASAVQSDVLCDAARIGAGKEMALVVRGPGHAVEVRDIDQVERRLAHEILRAGAVLRPA
ncbi:hypothetical protein [Hydrogenophaga sp. PBL-H3]|uniref:hypothetical protein n=1 Tax=Hydrogenophaga sp. PBL-H3 TaxID=434010 RepID=UPI0013586C32|nr:hypothetical protein [Hydrogenophaga sp. PBL-H3]